MKFRIVASDLGEPGLVEAAMDEFAIIERGTPVSGVTGGSGALSAVEVNVLPNPLSREGRIQVTMPSAVAHASLELFDYRGERVAVIHTGAIAAGTTSFPLDVASLASGRYLWKLTIGGARVQGAVVVVR